MRLTLRFRSPFALSPCILIDFIKNLYDPVYMQGLIHSGGVPLIAAIVFAETGLLVGFFLPGDTMLFIAGVAAATTGPSGEPS